MQSKLPKINASLHCSLCGTSETKKMSCLEYKYFGDIRRETYWSCIHCGLVFLDPKDRLSYTQERERYLAHNNDPQDERYLSFLMPAFLKAKPFLNLLDKNQRALDFGCGKGKPFSQIFDSIGYVGDHYDPFFFDDQNLLEKKYDWVTCTEVIEHIFDISSAMNQIFSLLKPNGVLSLMTNILTDDIEFTKWWYVKDPTHVSFFRPQTIDFLSQHWALKVVYLSDNLVVFQK